MGLSLRHAVRGMILGSGVISLPVGAAVDPSKSASSVDTHDGSGHPVDTLIPETGILISIVLVALVVIARRSRHRN